MGRTLPQRPPTQTPERLRETAAEFRDEADHYESQGNRGLAGKLRARADHLERRADRAEAEGEGSSIPYAQGKRACRDGKAPLDNPHPSGSSAAEAWRLGYFDELSILNRERGPLPSPENAEETA